MAAAAIAAAIPAVMGIIDKLSPSSSTTGASTLTADQRDILGQLAGGSGQAIGSLYDTLGGQVNDPTDSYEGLEDFEGQFQRQYEAPLRRQYEMDLAGLSGSPELFSGGNLSGRFRAMNNLNTNLASARATMMMGERDKQLASREASLGRQLQSAGLLSNFGTAGLGVKGTENIVQQNQSLLGTLGNVGQASGNLAQVLQGVGQSGSSGGTPDTTLAQDELEFDNINIG